MPGILTLLFNDQPVAVARYKSETEKSKLWQRWKTYYGPAYKKAVLKDEPDPYEEKVIEVKEDGKPVKTKSRFKKGSLPAKHKFFSNHRKRRGYKF